MMQNTVHKLTSKRKLTEFSKYVRVQEQKRSGWVLEKPSRQIMIPATGQNAIIYKRLPKQLKTSFSEANSVGKQCRDRACGFSTEFGDGGSIKGQSLSWFWSDESLTQKSRPHRTERAKAERVNTNTQTAPEVRNGAAPPASPIPLIHPLSRARFRIINTMTATLILRPLTGVCRSLYLFSAATKESQVLFCIHEEGETCIDSHAITGLTVSSWVCRALRSGLVITRARPKQQQIFNRACGWGDTTISQVICVNGAFEIKSDDYVGTAPWMTNIKSPKPAKPAAVFVP